MDKNLSIILFGLSLLIIALFIGFPIEFLNIISHKIANVILLFLVSFTFYKLFKLSKKINSKVTKWLTISAIVFTAVPYLINGIAVVFFLTSNYYPMWEDMEIYSKPNGEKVIHQFRETSGSLHDYRTRKIYLENEHFRISINSSKEKMSGTWNVHSIKKNSNNVVELD